MKAIQRQGTVPKTEDGSVSWGEKEKEKTEELRKCSSSVIVIF